MQADLYFLSIHSGLKVVKALASIHNSLYKAVLHRLKMLVNHGGNPSFHFLCSRLDPISYHSCKSGCRTSQSTVVSTRSIVKHVSINYPYRYGCRSNYRRTASRLSTRQHCKYNGETLYHLLFCGSPLSNEV